MTAHGGHDGPERMTAHGGHDGPERPPLPAAVVGVAASLGAYLIWGLFPLYFHALASVPAPDVLAHRIVWSAVFLALVIAWQRRWGDVVQGFARRAVLRLLVPSALAIALNWGVFIWAVEHGHVLESSQGYFMCPLLSVVLGVVFLGERLRAGQWLAVALAAVGVGYEVAAAPGFPFVALTLAVSWATYGLLRKLAAIDPVAGLFIEALLLAPLAIVHLFVVETQGAGMLARPETMVNLLLVLAGPVTALPLILFVAGTRRISLATVGLLQYLTPTGHLAIAVLVFDEAFSADRLVSFVCIWAALAIYSGEGLWRRPPGGT